MCQRPIRKNKESLFKVEITQLRTYGSSNLLRWKFILNTNNISSFLPAKFLVMILKKSAIYPFFAPGIWFYIRDDWYFQGSDFFDDIDNPHFPDEEDIVKFVDCDCGFTFRTAVPQKI